MIVNSLLFGVCSPPLREIFKRKCFEKLTDEWALVDVRLPIFRSVETYISKRKLPELGEYEAEEILVLMKQAQAWELSEQD